ncbi:hypothetical protein [Rhodosalinus sediminis]|uniref:hypothetical protein n=1 Tax=Rhodosalinus sediminis TaxID=1940533 RepID=UPI0011C034B1|nr:hypothetical protein [Rhodosalinus sediminis]
MKPLFAFIAFISCFCASPVFSAGLLVILCEAQQWTGQRVGFRDDGELENDQNFQNLKETLFVLDEYAPQVGNTVHVKYGEDRVYQGEVRYIYRGSKSYLTIETQPADILEVYSIDMMTGNATLTITKQLFGFYTDVFTGQCEVRLVEP